MKHKLKHIFAIAKLWRFTFWHRYKNELMKRMESTFQNDRNNVTEETCELLEYDNNDKPQGNDSDQQM